MCLVLFSYKTKPGYRLILAANRDEFFARPTTPLYYWDDEKEILAGRDIKEGGTWLGITRSGKFGALTNYRETNPTSVNAVSRGEILTDYFLDRSDIPEFLQQLSQKSERYRGFNLLIGNEDGLYYYSNRSESFIQLQPGIYGLSNHLLNTSWPKVDRGKKIFEGALAKKNLCVDDLFAMLTDTNQPADEYLPQTGVGTHWERILAPMFISSAGYGTRSSAVLTIADNGCTEFHERTFNHDGGDLKTVCEKCFTINESNAR